MKRDAASRLPYSLANLLANCDRDFGDMASGVLALDGLALDASGVWGTF